MMGVFVLLLLFSLMTAWPAWAQETVDGESLIVEGVVAPELDYTFSWPTFIVAIGLVVGYYVYILRLSEKEFKGVIDERFGVDRESEL